MKLRYRTLMKRAKVAFVISTQRSVGRNHCLIPILCASDLGTWLYRCEQDQRYVANLCRLLARTSAGETLELTDDLLSWADPILFYAWLTEK